MGMFDTVWVPCPSCGTKIGFQTKSGDCSLEDYELHNVPSDVAIDIRRHAPYPCPTCNALVDVSLQVIIIPTIVGGEV